MLPAAGGPPIARARLTVDLDAIVENWRALDRLSAPTVETAAVVKADAYGLGLAPVAQRLHAAGVRSFFVAYAEEGAALRAAIGPDAAIFVFSGAMPGDVPLCREHGLVPCLNSPEQAEAVALGLPGHPVAIQIDSGMNRLGLEPPDLPRLAAWLDRLDLRLVLSHLACADEPDRSESGDQQRVFDDARARLPGAAASLAATGGILLGPAFHLAMTRPGIGLYGGRPFAAARPVVRLDLPVIQVRDVAAGESVGYGAEWTARRPSRIATVAAGYADGLLRQIGEGGLGLRSGGRACPLVGRVSMDLITVDVTDLPEVPGSLAVLDAEQGVDTVATAAGTIGYEILTALGARYDRVYLGLPREGAPDPEAPEPGSGAA